MKEIQSIKKYGFDFVEIGIEWPEGSVEKLLKKRKAIIKLLKENKMFAIGHTAWWMDFSSPYEGVRKAWIKEAKRKIDAAKKLGISQITFHTHSRIINQFYKKYHEEALENFISSLKELVEYAKKKNVEILIENAGEWGEITSFNLIKYIAYRVPEIKIHLDIGHAYIFGGMKNVKRFILTFKDRIAHLHMHDNRGKKDEHLPIGKGKINYKTVVKLLKRISYNGTITFEVFTSRKDAKKSMEKIRKLWEAS
ncbi:MAG: sugar phosphate isomerase/epimerase family protein [Candidatus Aenigmatarchaeota archaeon]